MKIETFLEQHLNVELYEYQMKMVSRIADPSVKRLAIRWNRSVGKSFAQEALRSFYLHAKKNGCECAGGSYERILHPQAIIVDEWAEYERSLIREHTPKPKGSYVWNDVVIRTSNKGSIRVVYARSEIDSQLRGLFTDACYFF